MRVAALLTAVLLAVTGCTDASSGDGSGQDGAGAGEQPAVTFTQPGGGTVCVPVGRAAEYAFFPSPIEVHRGVTLTGVSIEGTGVRLQPGSFSLPPADPEGTIALDGAVRWPLGPDDLNDDVQWAVRDSLDAASYAEGDTTLPVVHVKGKRGGVLDSFTLLYTRDGADTPEEATYEGELRLEADCDL